MKKKEFSEPKRSTGQNDISQKNGACRRYLFPHPAVWMFLGYAGGLAAVFAKPFLLLVVLAMLWLWLAYGNRWYKTGIFLGILFLLVGLVAGSVAQQKTENFIEQHSVPETVQIEGSVRKHQPGQNYLWMKSDNINYLVLLGKEAPWYPPGSQIQVQGTMSLPEEKRNPGGFDRKTWLWGNGALAEIAADVVSLEKLPVGQYALSMKVRIRLQAVLDQQFTNTNRELIRAILFGEKHRLEERFYRKTQRLGTAHIFAVSGLHVGFAVSLLVLLFRFLKLERSLLGIVLMGICLYGYCLLIGFPPSAVRASVMVLLAFVGRKLLGPVVPMDFLAICGLVLSIFEPWIFFTAGFQLSFGVTGALLVFASPLQKWLAEHGVPSKTAGALSVVLASWLGSAPIMAGQFYSVSLFSPLANLVLVPIISLAVPLLIVSLLLSCCWAPMGLLPGIMGEQLLNITVAITNWLDHSPVGFQWNVGHQPVIVFLSYLVLLLILWIELTGGRSWPSYWVRKGIFLGFLALLLAFLVPHAPSRDTLTYLYAGQGSSAVLRTTRGETFLFDCGSSSSELLSQLRWMGVNRIDGILLSHGDADHIGGLEQVMESIPVKGIIGAEGQLAREPVRDIIVNSRWKVPVMAVTEPAWISAKAGRIWLFPVVGEISKKPDNNREELAVAYDNGTVVVAFPGDLEETEAELFAKSMQHISVWTVPHHGSRYSLSPELFDTLKQKGVQFAIISSGVQNRFGHPHQETLKMLDAYQIPYLRTDREGAITIQL